MIYRFRSFPAFLLIALIAAAGSLYGCGPHASASQQSQIPIRTATPQRLAFSREVELAGTVTAIHSVTVGAVTSGRIVALPVRVGDGVDSGAVLAQIDPAPYQAAVAQAQGAANAATANRQLAAAQAAAAESRLTLAEATAKRMSWLYARGGISKQQQDETQADLSTARAAAAQAQAAVSAAAGQVQASQANTGAAQVPLQNSTVRAPFAGTITTRLVDVGAVVGAGSPIVTMEDGRNLEIDLAAPEDDTRSFEAGRSVTIRVDALGNRPIAGRIRAVVPTEGSSSHSVVVKVAVLNPQGLLPGMYARVKVPLDIRVATAVPAAALTNRAGQDGVFAVSGGHAHFIPVDTGATRPGFVEVRGLPNGTRFVAASNTEELTDNAAVLVQRP